MSADLFAAHRRDRCGLQLSDRGGPQGRSVLGFERRDRLGCRPRAFLEAVVLTRAAVKADACSGEPGERLGWQLPKHRGMTAI